MADLPRTSANFLGWRTLLASPLIGPVMGTIWAQMGTNRAQTSRYGAGRHGTCWHESVGSPATENDETPGQLALMRRSPGAFCVAPPTGFEPVPPP